jgi:hypothetical protein
MDLNLQNSEPEWTSSLYKLSISLFVTARESCFYKEIEWMDGLAHVILDTKQSHIVY